jgi:hypothetical protein
MANRYWRGTASTAYNNVNNWSDTSGGATGFSIPGSSDVVIFDGNGNNPCVLDATRGVTSISFDATFTSSFNLQTFSIVVQWIGTVITLSPNATYLGTAGSAFFVLDNPAQAGVRTIVGNGTSIGNVSLQVKCGNSVTFTGLIRVWRFFGANNTTTYNAGVGGSIEVQQNFDTDGGSVGHTFNVPVTMVGTGSITQGSFNFHQNLRIDTAGRVTISYMNCGGSITNVRGFAPSGYIDCGIFTGSANLTLTGFDNTPITTLVPFGSKTLILGSNLRVVNLLTQAAFGGSNVTLQGAFKLLVERSVTVTLDSAGAINSFTGSAICLVGDDVIFSNASQASINVTLEINTPGRVTFNLPNFVVLSGSPTGYAHSTNGAITVVRGNVIIPRLLCLRLTGSGGVTLRGMNKVKWSFVSINNNVEYIFDEFFCGTPERPVVISGTYSISFTTQGERFTRFVNLGNATVTRKGQLVVTTKGNRSNAVGVRYYNQSPNGISKRVTSLDDSTTSVPSNATHPMLMGDPAIVGIL